MELRIPVDEILLRVPERAHRAYTNLVVHEETLFDRFTGWSRASITQQQLAEEMECSLRTAERAICDLRRYGLARVLAWPGTRTETQVRVSDVSIGSPFGPLRKIQAARPRHLLVDDAINHLVEHNRRIEADAAQT